MLPEMYRAVKDFPHYEVSNYGNVRSWYGKQDYPKQLKKYCGTGRYLTVGFSKDGKGKTSKIHHLVLKAFVSGRPFKYDACHNNGNRQDNRLENLRWDTSKNNSEDTLKHNGAPPRVDNQVTRLRKKLDLTQVEFGKLIGVNFSMIHSWERGHWPISKARKIQLDNLLNPKEEQ